MASKAARRGLKAENRLIDAINSKNELGKKLIKAIEKRLGLQFTSCSACKSPARIKSDIRVTCNDKCILISVKEFDVKADYNHVERNYVDFYSQKWSMPRDVYVGLKRFVGEVDKRGNPVQVEAIEKEARRSGMTPGKLSKKRRTFINRLPKPTQNTIKEFFNSNKRKILKDILIADEDIAFFIIIKREDAKAYYYIVPTKDMLDTYDSGDVSITPRGSLQMGKIIIQRKSGDHQTPSGWADRSASQLQFKIRPSECIRDSNPIMQEKVR